MIENLNDTLNCLKVYVDIASDNRKYYCKSYLKFLFKKAKSELNGVIGELDKCY